MFLKNKNIIVLGFSNTGRACCQYFKEKRANIFVYDDALNNSDKTLAYTFISSVKDIEGIKIAFCIFSPGIDIKNNSFAQSLLQQGIKLISEIDFSLKKIKSKIIAVTGTNGKSTATAFLNHIFLSASKRSHLVGNIGVPLISQLNNIRHKDIVCVEISSYMLEYSHNIKPNISLLLNIQRDHLQRHKTMENYIGCKKKIFELQTKNDRCVVNYDNDFTREMFFSAPCPAYYFSHDRLVKGCYVRNNSIHFCDDRDEKVCSLDEIHIIGEQNKTTLCGCVTVAKLLGVDNEIIERAIKSFEPLEHRIETVNTINGLTFINDSKATNLSSTIFCLEALSDKKSIILLLGGDFCIDELSLIDLRHYKNISGIVCFGGSGKDIYKHTQCLKTCEKFLVDTMEDAFNKSLEVATSGAFIVLSPAGKSFDEFKDFEHRGKAFKAMVKTLEKD